MKEGLIGVIVPVYKVEKYIAECIESILAQTYTNFRLILVDDGTPDNAGNICDEYAKKDSRITVIHQENAGVTRARARGVEEASNCEWITFVDSDDTLTKNALEILFKNQDEISDIILSLSDDNFKPDKELVSIEEFTKMLLLDKSMCVTLWGKLYRRTILTGIIFDIPRQISLSEDIVMNLRITYNYSPIIKAINEKIYNYRYRVNKNSAGSTFKTTPEYETTLLKYKMDAIPCGLREKYRPYTIERRVFRWRGFWRYKYFCRGMTHTPFYKELKNDIETYQYKLEKIDHILFYNNNPLYRFFIINWNKVKIKFRKYISIIMQYDKKTV